MTDGHADQMGHASDGGIPGPDDALTVAELIARLERVQLRYGGDVRCFMPDYEPICQINIEDGGEPIVFFCDRFNDQLEGP